MKKTKGKYLSRLLSAVIVLALSFSILGTQRVNAGTNGHSADDAIAWVSSKNGQALDWDGAYGAQCVDLLFYYVEYLGQAHVGGNAKDFATNNISAWTNNGWQRIQGATPQKGDILIYTDGTYGHVAIFESDSYTWHQNFDNKQYVQRVASSYWYWNRAGYWGVIRPAFDSPAVSFSFEVIGPEGSHGWKNQTDASLYGKITCNQYINGGLLDTGMQLGTSSGNYNLCGGYNDYHEHWNGPLDYSTWLWYECKGDLGVTLSPGTKYYYRFWVRYNGSFYYSAEASFVTDAPSAPAIPTNVKASSSTNSTANITWNAVSGATGYEVYRATAPNGTYAFLGWVSGTSKTSKALKAGTTYYYKVRAFKTVNGTKYYSDYSTVVNVTPKPSKPTNIKVSVSNPTSVKITWTVPSSAEYVQIWRATKENAEQSDYSLIGTYAKTTTSAISKYLTPNKTYYYKLRSYVVNSSGKKVYSPFSSVFSAKPSVSVGKPTGLKVSSTTKNSVTLTWNAVSGTNIRYEVYRVEDIPGKLVDRMKNTTITETGLKSKTTYCYRIRAYFYYTDANGNAHRIYGAYTPIVTGTTK